MEMEMELLQAMSLQPCLKAGEMVFNFLNIYENIRLSSQILRFLRPWPRYKVI